MIIIFLNVIFQSTSGRRQAKSLVLHTECVLPFAIRVLDVQPENIVRDIMFVKIGIYTEAQNMKILLLSSSLSLSLLCINNI